MRSTLGLIPLALVAACTSTAEPVNDAAAGAQPSATALEPTPTEAKSAPAPVEPSAPEPVAAEEAPDADAAQRELEAQAEAIRLEIEELRGEKFVRPVEVRVAGREEFLAYARERVELEETPESLRADETLAKLLGLVPADMDLMASMLALLEGQVGGFYDPTRDRFYLMKGFEGDIARIILAHELTHALDDQLHDIDGTAERLSDVTDREFAYHSVVEGSGMALMNLWAIKHIKEVDMEDLAAAQDMNSEALAEAPPFLWKPLLAVYLRGQSFLQRSDKMSLKKVENADVRRAFEDPPRSMEQVLHPAKYWEPEQRDEPIEIAHDRARVPDGWTVAAEDVLGELLLALVVMPPAERTGLDATNPFALMMMKYTDDAATGWGGDHALLLERGDARILQLVTRWDSAQDAGEFAAALREVAGDDGPIAKNLLALSPDASQRGIDVHERPDDREVVLAVWHGTPDGARIVRELAWTARER